MQGLTGKVDAGFDLSPDMLTVRFAVPLLAALSLCAGRSEAVGEVAFHEQVWPILERACVKCHGPEKQKGELRLDSLEAALKGGKGGAAVVPGNVEKSLLRTLIQHEQPDGDRMPPKEKLHPDEIAIVEKWIAAGALWPEKTASPVATAAPGEKLGNAWSDPRNPIVRIFGGRRLDLWSLRPIAEPEQPTVRNEAWVRQPLDRFVLAGIERADQKPADEASRQTLVRRLYFDVIGLPPTPEEAAAFVADSAPDAYERLVDQLLASPRYGEHWARMWLDVVRYSDSNGFDWDEFRPEAWRFRDYVARSFNFDKPFDKFVREQLAGDEMVKAEPLTAAEQDALIATGYLRMGPHDNSAALFGETKKVRQQLMSDLVDTTGSAFLGMTMSCCRCHDHKYDPLSHADHYRLRAFFEPMQPADDLPVDLAQQQQEIRDFNDKLKPEIAAIKEQIDTLLAPVKSRLVAERRGKLSDEERALLDVPAVKEKGVSDQLKSIQEKLKVPDKELEEGLDPAGKTQHTALSEALAALQKRERKFSTALIARDGTDVPPTRVLEGGNLEQEKEPVVPGFLSALDPNPAKIDPPARAGSTGRRSALAEWIVSETNPLTARVLVNRIWQSYFGEGIVATANDFGLAGARPTNPELLDWLASAFTRRTTDDAATQPALAWSLKSLHRLILTSATYRQSSSFPETERAAPSQLMARQIPRRLSAEALRDSMLAVSGRLLATEGGPPIWPALPQEVLNANPAVLDDNKEKTKGWYPSPPEKSGVRSLYVIQKRNIRVPLLETFDLPENSTSCARRNISTVAPQALTLLNSPFATEMAHAFAGRIEAEAGDAVEAQVERAFALALQRAPDAEERLACVNFRKERGLPEFCRAVLNLNEFVYFD